MGVVKYQKGSDLALTVMQSAVMLGVSDYAIRKLIKRGQLRGIPVGKTHMIPKMAIDELLRGEKPTN